jgi:hypothetical protein
MKLEFFEVVGDVLRGKLTNFEIESLSEASQSIPDVL